jgi:hypothetical protein
MNMINDAIHSESVIDSGRPVYVLLILQTDPPHDSSSTVTK